MQSWDHSKAYFFEKLQVARRTSCKAQAFIGMSDADGA